MPKKINHVFYEQLNFINMYKAYERASKGKAFRPDVIKFSIDLETNIMNLVHSIKTKKYQLGTYQIFTIYEPKERIIKSLPFKDRIVHQWFVESFLNTYIIPKFINDTYACLKNKGTHKAVRKCQKYMRLMKKEYGSYYVLKCDIKKFFYSINKTILFDILKKYFKDKDLLEFLKILIFDNEEKGIPIGNYTSQYFANIYLNELDHYIKEELRIKYYIRYMDDFILLIPNKEMAKFCFEKIEHFVKDVLDLELNQKSKYYKGHLGVDFCGYKIYESHILLRKSSKKKIRKKIKKWNERYQLGTLNDQKALLSFNSWLGHAKHANSYHLVSKYQKLLDFNLK